MVAGRGCVLQNAFRFFLEIRPSPLAFAQCPATASASSSSSSSAPLAAPAAYSSPTMALTSAHQALLLNGRAEMAHITLEDLNHSAKFSDCVLHLQPHQFAETHTPFSYTAGFPMPPPSMAAVRMKRMVEGQSVIKRGHLSCLPSFLHRL
jgi:hypothetical protein